MTFPESVKRLDEIVKSNGEIEFSPEDMFYLNMNLTEYKKNLYFRITLQPILLNLNSDNGNNGENVLSAIVTFQQMLSINNDEYVCPEDYDNIKQNKYLDILDTNNLLHEMNLIEPNEVNIAVNLFNIGAERRYLPNGDYQIDVKNVDKGQLLDGLCGSKPPKNLTIKIDDPDACLTWTDVYSLFRGKSVDDVTATFFSYSSVLGKNLIEFEKDSSHMTVLPYISDDNDEGEERYYIDDAFMFATSEEKPNTLRISPCLDASFSLLVKDWIIFNFVPNLIPKEENIIKRTYF